MMIMMMMMIMMGIYREHPDADTPAGCNLESKNNSYFNQNQREYIEIDQNHVGKLRLGNHILFSVLLLFQLEPKNSKETKYDV